MLNSLHIKTKQFLCFAIELQYWLRLHRLQGLKEAITPVLVCNLCRVTTIDKLIPTCNTLRKKLMLNFNT